ncbi:DUF4982 domain-containing protein [candidate division KSB1 bacterium]|nr:DUF4982 domain-containing protein [candidate division KSB1 bacterium]
MVTDKNLIIFILLVVIIMAIGCAQISQKARNIVNFGRDWKFHLGEIPQAQQAEFDDSAWRSLNLPHDWSIEGEFSQDHPASPGGGALPGGIGWYRKTFTLPESDRTKLVFIDFDGVYRNSEVWINGNFLGKRPYGYSSFRYELTPHLKYGAAQNVIAVRVDNSQQPNSRWYSGSGIYRNVWLVVTDQLFVDHWGTTVTTPEVSAQSVRVLLKTKIRNSAATDQSVTLQTIIYDAAGKKVAAVTSDSLLPANTVGEMVQKVSVHNPILWSLENRHLYQAVSQVMGDGKLRDDYTTTFGIRYFVFDSARGFSLNGKPTKILGVCNHHDLGCLGAAINTRALERQLEILKAMGCNGIRTSHNPPAPELLDLCDRMGFIVMDEAFDMWKLKKTEFDYHLDYDQWHQRDLEDFIRRDRNHPSVFMWSVGNEILEQWDSTGTEMARELVAIVKNLDPTRPVTSAFNDPQPNNYLIKSGAFDLIGYNYHHPDFVNFLQTFPGKQFIGSETNSALASRGEYDLPSATIRRWPIRWDKPFTEGNPDFTCSAYDNCCTPWGSTQEETWKIIKKYDFLAGLYVWTGFDYLGEPTPYSWPARSSYFGIVDLAGFPKDAYYFYQSEWTDQPVLHLFPHWNWKPGEVIDIWAYTNYDTVELFLNDQSLGSKQKTDADFKLVWQVPFTPGTLKAMAHAKGKASLIREIKTAGKPAQISLAADRSEIRADGRDLAFITVKVLDRAGILVPQAHNLINFEIEGAGVIAGVDNGHQISHEPFQANYRKAFNGLCLAVIQSKEKPGTVVLKATSADLEPARLEIRCQ